MATNQPTPIIYAEIAPGMCEMSGEDKANREFLPLGLRQKRTKEQLDGLIALIRRWF